MSDWLLAIDPRLVPFMQMMASAGMAAASLVEAAIAFKEEGIEYTLTVPLEEAVRGRE